MKFFFRNTDFHGVYLDRSDSKSVNLKGLPIYSLHSSAIRPGRGRGLDTVGVAVGDENPVTPACH